MAEEKIIRCPNCGIEIDMHATFCYACGYKFENEVKCNVCGVKVKENQKFCKKCGNKL